MIYVYCKRGSDSARALSDAVGGKRLRVFDGMNFLKAGKKVKFQKGDCIVGWGEPIPELAGIHILNGKALPNKYRVAIELAQKEIPTIEAYPSVPKSARNGFIGRKFDHVGGNDLLNPTNRPDFYVKKVNIVEEYRIHSFKNQSIRAGKKIVREGYSTNEAEVASSNGALKLASSWIRSFDGGWRICYDGFQSTKEMRKIAHSAVEALGLDFGAVDIGKLDNGKLIVLEVNRAPGLEGGSIEKYAEHVKEWVANANSGNETAGDQRGKSVQPSEGQTQPVGTSAAPPQTPGPSAPNTAPAAAGPAAITVERTDPQPEPTITITGRFTGAQYASTQRADRRQSASNENARSTGAANAVPNDPPTASQPAGTGNSRISWDQLFTWNVLSSNEGPNNNGNVQAAGAQFPRQSVQPPRSAGGFSQSSSFAGSSSQSRIFDVQRRRVTWSTWNNRLGRITDPAQRRRALAEATKEARAGRLPFDPTGA